MEVCELKYAIKITADHPESSEDGSKPDLSMYRTDVGENAWTIMNGSGVHSAKAAWGWIIMPIEIKNKLRADPFEDTSQLRASEDNDGRSSQAQLIKYVAEVQARQHRTSVFSLFIVKNKARLIRWDRIGAIVSKPFFYIRDTPSVEKDGCTNLLNYVYKIASASAQDQGYDPTVIRLSEDDPLLLKLMKCGIIGAGAMSDGHRT